MQSVFQCYLDSKCLILWETCKLHLDHHYYFSQTYLNFISFMHSSELTKLVHVVQLSLISFPTSKMLQDHREAAWLLPHPFSLHSNAPHCLFPSISDQSIKSIPDLTNNPCLIHPKISLYTLHPPILRIFSSFSSQFRLSIPLQSHLRFSCSLEGPQCSFKSGISSQLPHQVSYFTGNMR